MARRTCCGRHLNMLRVLIALIVLGLSACASVNPKAVPGDNVAAALQLDQAEQLVADKNWPQAIAALQVVIEATPFHRYPSDIRYRALSTAGKVAANHGKLEPGYEYLVRVTAMPQATFYDWLERMHAARKLGHEADSVNCLTWVARRWPDRIVEFNGDYVVEIVDEASHLSHGVRLPLLQALYDAHWKLKWDVEPSSSWRDLALLLLENGSLAKAIEVSSHVTDAYVLVAMRADRRFDAVVSANPAEFDIEAAADQEFHWFQSASEKTPQSLELQSDVIRVLAQQQHYAAMLASADSVLFAIQSTNFPRKLYQDYDEQLSSFLNLREVALERAGRWDEAVAQLTKASLLSEEYGGNVSQLINLGSLYCALGRPKEALTAVDNVLAATSAYGASAMEIVRLDAAVQMGDSKQVRHSLRFLRTHRADSSSDYEYALIVTNQLDRAAGQLKAQLLDQDERQHALLSVQTYAPATGTARELELDARQRTVIARRDVQAVIQRVGRVETYRLESDAYN
jgi:tetratricopeptide (TPR) repeat protein